MFRLDIQMHTYSNVFEFKLNGFVEGWCFDTGDMCLNNGSLTVLMQSQWQLCLKILWWVSFTTNVISEKAIKSAAFICLSSLL